MSFSKLTILCVLLSLSFSSETIFAWTNWSLPSDVQNNGVLSFNEDSLFKINKLSPAAVPIFPFGSEHIGLVPKGTTGRILQVKNQTQFGLKSYAVQIEITQAPKKGPQSVSVSDKVWVWVPETSHQIKFINHLKISNFATILSQGKATDVGSNAIPSSTKAEAQNTESSDSIFSVKPGLPDINFKTGTPSASQTPAQPPAKPTTQPTVKPTGEPTPLAHKPTVPAKPPAASSDPYRNYDPKNQCTLPITPEYEASPACAPKDCDDPGRRPQNTRFKLLPVANQNAILKTVSEAAQAAKINPAMMMALLDEETIFGILTRRNRWGDEGIAQFQPGTAIATLTYWRSVSGPNSPVNKIKGNVQFSHGPKNCGTLQTGLRPNTNCREFSIWLMAFHIKQILAKAQNPIGAALINDDPVAEMRYIASVYNRGVRIERSFIASGKSITAKSYGELWEVGAQGGLKGQYINRCYVYRTAGLCGGLGDSLVAQYTKLFCDRLNTNIPGLNNGSVK